MEKLGRFLLTDSLACLGSIPATMQEKLDLLRTCLGGDGVHLSEQGRFHLFNNLAKTVLSLKDGSIGKPPKPAEAAACSLISGRKYYWRGFDSDRGSTSRPSAGRGGGRGGRSPGRARGNSGRELRRTAARRPLTAAAAVRQEEGEEEASNPHFFNPPVIFLSCFEFEK
jgi:hypothetical protein